jgi:hypothetical protein
VDAGLGDDGLAPHPFATGQEGLAGVASSARPFNQDLWDVSNDLRERFNTINDTATGVLVTQSRSQFSCCRQESNNGACGLFASRPSGCLHSIEDTSQTGGSIAIHSG